nr:hypothetical protein [Tanacetum cinerariifolium]
MNDLEIKFDQFQKQCEQMQDDLLNQMRNFMQNFQNGPPGEDKEPEATTDTELPSTEDIQPLPEQEVKNVVEQPAERRNRAEKSWQNSRVVHKSSISFKNTSQISLIHSIAPIESTKEPEHLLSMGSYKLDPHCFNVESDFVESFLNRDTFIDFSSKFDFSGELAHIKPEIPKSDFDFEEEIRLIENLLYDNSFPRPPEELNAEIADTIIESIPLLPIPEEIDIVTETDDVLPPSDDNDDDYDLLLEEELLVDNSILSHESSDSNFEDNPSISQPPPEPPDDNFNLEPEDYLPKIEDFLCIILSWFSRPS